MKAHVSIVKTWTINEHENPGACLDWMRENWHDLYCWQGENVDSLRAFCEHFGLSKPDYNISLLGNSYCAANVGDSDAAELQGVRLWKYLHNSGLLEYWKANPEKPGSMVRADLLAGNCPFTGYCFDENLLDPVREFIACPDNRTYQELIDDCLSSWVSAYVSDWEYAYSDEGLTELAQINDYEFTETGEIY